MIISIETKNNALLKYCSIPIAGWMLMLVIGFVLPCAPGVWITNLVIGPQGSPENDAYFPILGGTFMIAWNLFLQTKNIKIKLFFVPAWIWGAAGIVMGISRVVGL